VPLRRTDLVVAAVGAAGAVVATVIWGAAGWSLVPALLLGALIGSSRPFPRATWIAASAIFVIAGALDIVPGDASYFLVAAHGFCAGRWDGRWGYAAIAVLAGASTVAALLGGAAEAGFLFFIPAGWGAGRALRERELVAAQLADRARELEEEREAFATLSVRYERARIASELHDIVAHAISLMVIQATAGQRLAARDPERTAETFAVIADAARQAEADMGRLVALLGDEDASAPAPDLALVEELVARAAGSGLDVTLRLEGERENLPEPAAEVAYRVVQEGLTNALRYAAGAPVTVLVRGERDALVVEVGNDPADADGALSGAGTGNGLRGLRERVDACGGTLDAGRRPDGGWRLEARVPAQLTVRVAS
jgi:signal transduction histidine kinase